MVTNRSKLGIVAVQPPSVVASAAVDQCFQRVQGGIEVSLERQQPGFFVADDHPWPTFEPRSLDNFGHGMEQGPGLIVAAIFLKAMGGGLGGHEEIGVELRGIIE